MLISKRVFLKLNQSLWKKETKITPRSIIRKIFRLDLIRLNIYERALFFLLKDNILFWSVEVVKKRLWYKFSALYYGISINRSSKSNLYNLRRNIHRLEKGLSYPTPKDVFAEDYILETIKFLKEDKLSSYLDKNTKIWAEAVLESYFKTCTHSEKVSEAYKQYLSLKPENVCSNWIPYCNNSRPKLSVDYEALHQLAIRRRSVRFYLEKKVDSQLIKKAFKIAALSPSACNRQAFKFLFFNEEKIVKKISEVPLGIKGFELPSVIVVIGSYRGYFDERDINAPIIDASLAVMSFLFALETLNLSSVCINWSNLTDRDKKIRQLISLEKDEFVVMLVGVGYPSPEGKIPFSAKKEVEELLLVNQRIINNQS